MRKRFYMLLFTFVSLVIGIMSFTAPVRADSSHLIQINHQCSSLKVKYWSSTGDSDITIRHNLGTFIDFNTCNSAYCGYTYTYPLNTYYQWVEAFSWDSQVWIEYVTCFP